MALMAYRVCTQLRTNADQVDSITSTNLHLAGLAVNQLENRLHLLHLDASEENTYRQIFLLRIEHEREVVLHLHHARCSISNLHKHNCDKIQ